MFYPYKLSFYSLSESFESSFMTIAVATEKMLPAQKCHVCGMFLRPYYLNLDDVLYMCGNSKCTFPLMSEKLSSFIVPSSTSCSASGAISELTQDPFFAELFGDTSRTSFSQPESITPPVSGSADLCIQESNEDFINISLIHSALITVLCVSSMSQEYNKMDKSVIGNILSEIKDCVESQNMMSNYANKLVEIIAEKVLFFSPPASKVAIPVRLNQLLIRFIADAASVKSAFRVDMKTSAQCPTCFSSESARYILIPKLLSHLFLFYLII